jgi:hypothetical protein
MPENNYITAAKDGVAGKLVPKNNQPLVVVMAITQSIV